MSKKTIKLQFVGKEWDQIKLGEVPYPFSGHLEERYNLDFSDQPDYVISKESRNFYASCMMRYPEARIRILFAGEAFVPDFNLFDYAISFDPMIFGDRHFRLNTHNFFSFDPTLDELSKNGEWVEQVLGSERRFCNFVYSNGESNLMRRRMFEKLSAYKQIDAAGALLRNTERRIKTGENWMQDKVDFQKGYKFSIAIENSQYPGYTTEKLIHPMAAGSIPIYWGNEKVCDEFNPKAFINCHAYDSLDAVINRVIEVDQNDALYEQILREPWMSSAQVEANRRNAMSFKEFVHNIFDQELDRSRRRGDGTWTWRYEAMMRERIELYEKKLNSLAHRVRRRLQKWGLR